jgi:hypothetical protein
MLTFREDVVEIGILHFSTQRVRNIWCVIVKLFVPGRRVERIKTSLVESVRVGMVFPRPAPDV